MGSYKLGNVTVRTFNAAKFISLSRNSVVEEIEYIGNVVDDVDLEGGVERAEVVKADTVGIIGNVDTYKSCNGKLIETNAPIGVCCKCNLKMKIVRCSVVNVMLLDENNKEYQVTMFNNIIDQILMFSTEAASDASGDIADNHLNAPILCYAINHKDIVLSVST